MAAPSRINLEITRGDSPVIPFRYTTTSQPNGVDITGYVFTMTVNTEEDPTNTDNQQFQVTGVITTASEGRFTMQPTSTNTDLTVGGSYFFDISFLNGTQKETIAKGAIIVLQDIGKD